MELKMYFRPTVYQHNPIEFHGTPKTGCKIWCISMPHLLCHTRVTTVDFDTEENVQVTLNATLFLLLMFPCPTESLNQSQPAHFCYFTLPFTEQFTDETEKQNLWKPNTRLYSMFTVKSRSLSHTWHKHPQRMAAIPSWDSPHVTEPGHDNSFIVSTKRDLYKCYKTAFLECDFSHSNINT